MPRTRRLPFTVLPAAVPTAEQVVVAARLRSTVRATGLLLLAVCAGAYVALITFTAAGGPVAGLLAITHASDYRGMHAEWSNGLVIALTAGFGFLTGVWLLFLFSISGRQPDAAVQYQTFRRLMSCINRPVLAISVRRHVSWVVILLAIFVFVYPAQRAFGVLSAPDSGRYADALLALVLAPAIAAVGAATATLVSVVKKLSYPGQLRRHPHVEPTPRRGVTPGRRQGLDLVVAFAGGSLLILALLAEPDDAAGAALLVVPGVVAILLGVVMAFQAWRQSEPLYLEATPR